MSARRFLLLAGIAGGAVLGAATASAATSSDTSDGGGSWGQAWGEELPPEPLPARRPQTAPAPLPAAAAPMVAAAAPQTATPAASDIRGWGDAWGDDAPVQPVAPARRTANPVIAAPAPITAPAAVAPRVMQIQAPAASAPPKAAATALPGEEPVQLTADQIIHDRDLGIVTAKGRVEILQNGRALVSDQVSYNLRQDVITATGNVSLIETTGEVLFADYFELTGDLKEGTAQEIRILLADNSRMAAASARRVGGDRTDMDKAVYTACEPCREDPTRRPLWEAKAERVTHNQQDRVIEYRDAWLELGGVPVVYTPYLSHPDPTVRRQTGFLVPTVGMSSNLGANVTVPYFWAIRNNEDVTFAPRFLFPKTSTTEISENNRSALQRMVLAGEHRWAGSNGESRTVASLTADKNTSDLRGHVDAKGRFDLNRTWRAGYELQRASDDNYNSIYSYPIGSRRPWLTTQPYLEGFGRTNYTLAEAFAFQGLRQSDDPGQSPIVLPHMMFSHISSPSEKGGIWTMDSDLLAYGRSEGTDVVRLSSTMGWQRPFYGSWGDVTTIGTSLRADGYHSEELPMDGTANTGRVVPQVTMNWSMPFVENRTSLHQTIEPMAMVAASPNGGNPRTIPNEDSRGFELDELNVYRANRLPGLDRVEGGVRGAYGLRWRARPSWGGTIKAAAAQGWRAHDDSTFTPSTGFGDNLSDYLGRLDIIPNQYFSLYNRVRMDRRNGEIRRNENTVSAGTPMLLTSASYLMMDRQETEDGTLSRRHYVAFSVSSALTRYWSVQGSSSFDLTEEGGPIGWAARLIYNDECFAFVTNLRQNYTYDRDYQSGMEVTLNIIFKTLGDVPFNVF